MSSDDWRKVLDKNTNKFYFYNKKTKETSWNPPPGFVDPDAPPAALPPPVPAIPTQAAAVAETPAVEKHSPRWKEILDKSTGRPYYYNRKTKETSWDVPNEEYIPYQPRGSIIATNTATNLSTTSSVDPSRAQPVATPSATHVQAASPAPAAIPASQPAAASVAPTKPAAVAVASATVTAPVDEDDADENWRETTDAKTGRVYFYNKKTKKTSWEDPRKNKKAVTAASASTSAPAPAPVVSSPSFVSTTTVNTATTAPVSRQGTQQSMADEGSGDENSDTQLAARSTTLDKNLAQKLAVSEVQKADFKKMLDEEENDITAEEEENFSFLFAKHRKGILARTFRTGHVLSNQEIMTFKKSLIKKALLKQNRHVDAEAIQTFKNIMSYMGDRSSSKKGLEHVDKLLKNVMASPSGLRDEVYLQLCKQTTANPKESSTLLGWELLTFALATFPPSKPLKKFLVAYFLENIEGKEKHSEACLQSIRGYATNCMECLPKIMTLGQRSEVPSFDELEALKKLKGVAIPVYFIDNTHKTLIVDSYTLVGDVAQMIYKKLNLRFVAPFALFEFTSGVERILNLKERVLDIWSKWKHAESKTDGAQKQSDTEKNRFVFKARLILKTDNPEIKADPAAIDLMYLQSVHDVTTGRYPVKDNNMTILAALQLQATYGDFHADLHGHGWLIDKLDTYLPPSYFDKKKTNKDASVVRAEWEQKIISKYEKVKGFSSTEAKLNYLDYVQEWPVYGVTYFSVEQRQFKDYPSPLLLGITCEGALLLHPDTKAILDNYKYTDIVTWGHSDEKFILVVGNVVQQRKLVFKTTLGGTINQLVHDYVKYKVQMKNTQ